MDQITLVAILVAIFSLGLLATVAYQLSNKGADQGASSDQYFAQMQNIYNFQLPPESDEYEKLKASNADDKKVLAGALLKRAMAILPLVNRIRSDHEGIWKLKNKNMLRDSVFNSLLAAEKELQEEINYIQAEAQRLRPEDNWGHVIFQQAGQLMSRMQKPGPKNE